MNAQDQRNYEQYRPLSPFSYVLLSILYAIPVIGWIFLIIFTFSNRNLNRRNYTRSYWYRIIPLIAIFIFVYSSYPQLFPDNFLKLFDRIETQVTEILGSVSSNPSTQITNSTPLPLAQPSKAATTSLSSNGVTPSFREAMDSYEEFFNEYIDFFSNYSESDNPMLMMADYLKFISRYPDMIEKMEALDDEEDLSSADTAYYLEVTARIYRKLGESM